MNFPPIGVTAPRFATEFLIERRELVSDTSVYFYNIPQNFKHLKMLITGRTAYAAVRDNIALQFNNDGGANYYTHYWYAINGAIAAGTSIANIYGLCGQYFSATAQAGFYGSGSIFFPDYTNINPLGGGGAAPYKRWHAINECASNVAADAATFIMSGFWGNNGQPIRQIVVYGTGGAMVAGSTLELYGIL